MPTARVIVWLERGLFTAGGVLALWCAVSLARISYYERLPIPAPIRHELPSDRGSQPAAAAVSPPGAWLARLEAPSVALAATVLEGSDDRTLARAAGHIEDTALPGQPGNVGIAGHRDTIFRPLRHLRVGDPLTLTTSDGVFRYRVSSTTIVTPEDVYVLDPTDRPAVTLVTCYPFEFIGHAPRRFIVRADLVSAGSRLSSGATGTSAPGEP